MFPLKKTQLVCSALNVQCVQLLYLHESFNSNLFMRAEYTVLVSLSGNILVFLFVCFWHYGITPTNNATKEVTNECKYI